VSSPEELSYETTLLVRDCCLCLHVQRAARALARRFDDALRPFGLSNGQFSLLMSLNRPEPPGMASVANLLAMDRTTLTAALKPLERRGLVKIFPDLQEHLLPMGPGLVFSPFYIWDIRYFAAYVAENMNSQNA